MAAPTLTERNLRALVPLVTAALVRRYGDLASCEDAVQEALAEAAESWPRTGEPRNPRAWLVTAARRRYIDLVRSDSARRGREERDAALELSASAPSATDDSVLLLVLCCHPALPPLGQIALTLRAVCGLTTAQIASALYTSESAVTRRITRAKATIDAQGRRFPRPEDVAERAEAVRTVLYLMFSEGYAPAAATLPVHGEVVEEAIRITRLLHAATPTDGDTTALLGLMLLAHARTASRLDGDGSAVALPDQDRNGWDRALLAEGRALVAAALDGPPSALRIEAAIQAVHAAAVTADDTDWDQILALYDELVRLRPGPAPRLGRAVAVGMARGPLAGLAALGDVTEDPLVRSDDPRVLAVRAGLLERAGSLQEAARSFERAADATSNTAERLRLRAQAHRIHETKGSTP